MVVAACTGEMKHEESASCTTRCINPWSISCDDREMPAMGLDGLEAIAERT